MALVGTRGCTFLLIPFLQLEKLAARRLDVEFEPLATPLLTDSLAPVERLITLSPTMPALGPPAP
jgi:hypothetical protein